MHSGHSHRSSAPLVLRLQGESMTEVLPQAAPQPELAGAAEPVSVTADTMSPVVPLHRRRPPPAPVTVKGVDGGQVVVNAELEWLVEWLQEIQERAPRWLDSGLSKSIKSGLTLDDLHVILAKAPEWELARLQKMCHGTERHILGMDRTLDQEYTKVAVDNAMVRLSEQEEGITRMLQEGPKEAEAEVWQFLVGAWDRQVEAAKKIQAAFRAFRARHPERFVAKIEAKARYMDDPRLQGTARRRVSGSDSSNSDSDSDDSSSDGPPTLRFPPVPLVPLVRRTRPPPGSKAPVGFGSGSVAHSRSRLLSDKVQPPPQPPAQPPSQPPSQPATMRRKSVGGVLSPATAPAPKPTAGRRVRHSDLGQQPRQHLLEDMKAGERPLKTVSLSGEGHAVQQSSASWSGPVGSREKKKAGEERSAPPLAVVMEPSLAGLLEPVSNSAPVSSSLEGAADAGSSPGETAGSGPEGDGGSPGAQDPQAGAEEAGTSGDQTGPGDAVLAAQQDNDAEYYKLVQSLWQQELLEGGKGKRYDSALLEQLHANMRDRKFGGQQQSYARSLMQQYEIAELQQAQGEGQQQQQQGEGADGSLAGGLRPKEAEAGSLQSSEAGQPGEGVQREPLPPLSAGNELQSDARASSTSTGRGTPSVDPMAAVPRGQEPRDEASAAVNAKVNDEAYQALAESLAQQESRPGLKGGKDYDATVLERLHATMRHRHYQQQGYAMTLLQQYEVLEHSSFWEGEEEEEGDTAAGAVGGGGTPEEEEGVAEEDGDRQREKQREALLQRVERHLRQEEEARQLQLRQEEEERGRRQREEEEKRRQQLKAAEGQERRRQHEQEEEIEKLRRRDEQVHRRLLEQDGLFSADLRDADVALEEERERQRRLEERRQQLLAHERQVQLQAEQLRLAQGRASTSLPGFPVGRRSRSQSTSGAQDSSQASAPGQPFGLLAADRRPLLQVFKATESPIDSGSASPIASSLLHKLGEPSFGDQLASSLQQLAVGPTAQDGNTAPLRGAAPMAPGGSRLRRSSLPGDGVPAAEAASAHDHVAAGALPGEPGVDLGSYEAGLGAAAAAALGDQLSMVAPYSAPSPRDDVGRTPLLRSHSTSALQGEASDGRLQPTSHLGGSVGQLGASVSHAGTPLRPLGGAPSPGQGPAHSHGHAPAASGRFAHLHVHGQSSRTPPLPATDDPLLLVKHHVVAMQQSMHSMQRDVKHMQRRVMGAGGSGGGGNSPPSLLGGGHVSMSPLGGLLRKTHGSPTQLHDYLGEISQIYGPRRAAYLASAAGLAQGGPGGPDTPLKGRLSAGGAADALGSKDSTVSFGHRQKHSAPGTTQREGSTHRSFLPSIRSGTGGGHSPGTGLIPSLRKPVAGGFNIFNS